jgi:hypothetical protein
MQITKAVPNNTPIVLIYGGEGRGKTTLASKFPKPLAFLPERGLPRGVTFDAVEGINSLEDIMAALREVYTNPGEYRSLIFDTADALEALAIQHVCEKNSWKNIESPAYGKGWTALDDEWRRIIRAATAIRDKHSVNVVFTCHASIDRVDDPRVPSYTAYSPRLHRRGRALLMDACDCIFFLAEDLRVVTDDGGFRERTRAAARDERFLFTEGRPAYAAKNRYGMPEKIPLPKNFNFSELSQYWAPKTEVTSNVSDYCTARPI